MADRGDDGGDPRAERAGEVARERQRGAHYERRGDEEVSPEYQAVFELRADEVAARRSDAVDGLSRVGKSEKRILKKGRKKLQVVYLFTGLHILST